ncbi:pilus assembly protein [Alkalicaulis satelles]|uniref:Pilus assembly protein n=1 Tax=Alkalicaulis satelles TaxID=2609175 RepID=A0A5M6ZEH6_9PROT|nr:TadE/TadG family type IV pilus assembly protein [Alkalicaulis satelles]KAA5802217.1 pilus assembly protein [Alkalicaulis satelles]
MLATLARIFSPGRFVRDRRGVSAVEFALIAPLLIGLYLGAAQLTLALSADRKVSGAALIVADLAAQRDTITNAEIADYFAAGRAMTAPFDGSGMALRISSVRMDENGQIFLDWSVAEGMDPSAVAPSLPANLLAPGGSVIVVDAQMPFKTSFGDLFGSPVSLSDTAWLRPRRTGHVTNTSEPTGGVDAPPTELLPDPEPEPQPEPQPQPEPEPEPAPPPESEPEPSPPPAHCPPGHRRQGRC